MEGKRVVDSETIMTEMVMPNDTNPLGNLMGGNLMRWMDVAAGICAGKHAGAHITTASADHISFKRPVKIGEIVTIRAVVTRAFNTSMEIFVEVYISDIKGKNHRLANEAYLTFVALNDKEFKPTEVPPLVPVTSEEKRRYDGALRRRQLRLILAGRMKPNEATELKSLFTDLQE